MLQTLVAMNNAGGIDDDALLAGLPSWNDKIKLPFKYVGQNGMGSTLHNAESNTSDAVSYTHLRAHET